MKPPKAKSLPQEQKSFGEKAAAEVRAQCNKLTRAERERLMEHAMKLAYGKNWRAIAKRNNEKLAAELGRFTKEEHRQAQEEFAKWWYGNASITRTARRRRMKN